MSKTAQNGGMVRIYNRMLGPRSFRLIVDADGLKRPSLSVEVLVPAADSKGNPGHTSQAFSVADIAAVRKHNRRIDEWFEQGELFVRAVGA